MRSLLLGFKPLFLALSLLSLTACQSPPETRLSRTLSVSGKASVSIPATLTQIRLGVEVQGKTAEEVQQQMATRSQTVVNFLNSRQVDKLQTTGINLNPIYSYKNGKQSISGYSGTNIVSFRLESEKSGNLLDEAVKAGASRIDSVSFMATEDAIAQAQQQAIKEASDNAKIQANAALSAFNLSQKEIMAIQVGNANPPQPLPYAYPASSQAKLTQDTVTPVVAGEQKIEQAVTLQIRY